MTTDRTITVQVRDVYGRPMVYPACPQAVTFAAIAGTRTLSDGVLHLIESLGYSIRVEAPRIVRAGRS